MSQKIIEAKRQKENFQRTFGNCHNCGGILKKEACKRCKKCDNYFCYDCLDRITGKRYSNIEDLHKFFDENCTFCKQTCCCRLCQQKRVQKYSIPEITEKTIAAENALEGFNELSTCLNCQFKSRTREAVDIECSSCKKKFCLTCLKSDEKVKLF